MFCSYLFILGSHLQDDHNNVKHYMAANAARVSNREWTSIARWVQMYCRLCTLRDQQSKAM